MKRTAPGRQLMTMQNEMQNSVSTFFFGWWGEEQKLRVAMTRTWE